MKIGIIGAGFTGLSAAYYLQKEGHSVEIFEKDTQPGGLAIGYSKPEWNWSLEHHYHHWFTNDTEVLSLAEQIGYPVIIKRPKTSVYIKKKVYQLDSPLKLLLFPLLSPLERIRMAGVFALLFKINPFWQLLENIKITSMLPLLIGKKSYKLIWEPQIKNKLGGYADKISLVWFWARIKKRTTSLAYPSKGFLPFAQAIGRVVEKNKGSIHYNAEITTITQSEKKATITTEKKGKKSLHKFDAIIVTLPTPLFTKLTPQLPKSYVNGLANLEGIAATNMVLRLKKPLLEDKTYWLSICDTESEVMVIVEHTNFINSKNYNNEHLVYIGNYMKNSDEKFLATKESLLKMYNPLLTQLNSEYKKNLIDYDVFRAPFAQPIVPANYSKLVPAFHTPLSRVYLANMQQVYPWDRGTNYAVELGRKIAKIIIQDK
jgi:protoporphyrinogen oxidase